MGLLCVPGCMDSEQRYRSGSLKVWMKSEVDSDGNELHPPMRTGYTSVTRKRRRSLMTTRNPLTGTGVSRRDMLRLGAGGIGLGLFGGIGPVPPVFSQASSSVAANQSGKILVVFEWFGGNDGLNTIIPYGDPIYYKHRPTIGIKEKDLLKIDAYSGWHK